MSEQPDPVKPQNRWFLRALAFLVAGSLALTWYLNTGFLKSLDAADLRNHDVSAFEQQKAEFEATEGSSSKCRTP